MSGIYGILGLNDHDYAYLNTMGQQVIYDAVNEELRQQNEENNRVMSIFVEEETENFKERYKLPGGGRLQRMSGMTQAAAVGAYGKWDVAYPLYDFGAQVAQDRIDFAYATVNDLNRHLDTVRLQNINTIRFEILYALFHKTANTFKDRNHGDLTIEHLANGDSVLYPPVWGSEDEATADHYVETGYAAADISDANDPYEDIVVPKLTAQFGVQQGNSRIVTFINSAQIDKTGGLVDFIEATDSWIREGDQTPIPLLPGQTLPGVTVGRHSAGTWIQRWDWIPSGWMLAIHLDAPKPLKKRVHPASTGLPRDLALVSDSSLYPFTQSHYENHFGFGAGNRLNGVVVELGTGGSYTEPTAYA